MIHIYLIKAPLAGHNATRVKLAAADVLAHISTIYRALRGGTLEQVEDTLHIHLRISGTDRWKIASLAKQMGTTVLLRSGINPGDCSIELVEALPSRRNLTLAQGRKGIPVEPEPEPEPEFKFKGKQNPKPKRQPPPRRKPLPL